MSVDEKKQWDTYVANELRLLAPIISDAGYALDSVQPHLRGERHLMQSITTTSGRKLILLGSNIQSKRIVIKATRDILGKKEIEHERLCRTVLHSIQFAYSAFHSPKELGHIEKDGFTISIQEYIPQERPFLERTLEDQFSLAISAFKAQESAHATVYKHLRLVKKSFGSIDAHGYINAFTEFRLVIEKGFGQDLVHTLQLAETELRDCAETIEQYCGFLSHIDFVPHNFRVVGRDIYLLDHSSLRFGNKHEGWARFLNFMTLYHYELEEAILAYVRLNRAEEEWESLRLMRIYRLGEIMRYYAGTLARVSGDLQLLNRERVLFWGDILEATLARAPVPRKRVQEYEDKRDSLRSEEEKRRQVGLH